jgi:rod shape determining protein RodA
LTAIWFGLLCLSGTKKRYLAALVVLAAVLATFSWFFLLADYQRERVLTFVNPERDPLGAGYNVTQSIIAIGSGQFWGRGLGFGSQSQLHFLPEAQTDFIFSVIAEELGFVGASLVLFLYLLILWRLLRIIRHAGNDFNAYLAAGILLLFTVQIVVNLGAALGLLPVVGVTLPFLSYGGSSLIINLFLLGVAESVAQSGATKGQELTET